jgi:S-adenosylmethionine decarboxylase
MLHVMLDLYECNPELLADETFLWQMLDEYPDLIRMEKVSPVELRYITTSDPLDAGYSGFVIIATSHISLHVWPAYKMANMDIFSCEYFDQESVVRYAAMKFQSEDVEVHVVERATRSPRLATRQPAWRDSPATRPENFPGFKDSFGVPELPF